MVTPNGCQRARKCLKINKKPDHGVHLRADDTKWCQLDASSPNIERQKVNFVKSIPYWDNGTSLGGTVQPSLIAPTMSVRGGTPSLLGVAQGPNDIPIRYEFQAFLAEVGPFRRHMPQPRVCHRVHDVDNPLLHAPALVFVLYVGPGGPDLGG